MSSCLNLLSEYKIKITFSSPCHELSEGQCLSLGKAIQGMGFGSRIPVDTEKVCGNMGYIFECQRKYGDPSGLGYYPLKH